MVTQILLWIESHSGLASWLQAVGALTALFITLSLWRHDVRERSKQSESAAFGLAVSIIDELYEINHRLKWLLGKFPDVPNMVPAFGRNHTLHEGMKVPPKIENLDGRLHELGALALPVQSLILGMRQVEKLAERKMWAMDRNKEASREYDEQIIKIVYSLIIDIEKALEMVSQYFSTARKIYANG